MVAWQRNEYYQINRHQQYEDIFEDKKTGMLCFVKAFAI
jgi:hypothetical protein